MDHASVPCSGKNVCVSAAADDDCGGFEASPAAQPSDSRRRWPFRASTFQASPVLQLCCCTAAGKPNTKRPVLLLRCPPSRCQHPVLHPAAGSRWWLCVVCTDVLVGLLPCPCVQQLGHRLVQTIRFTAAASSEPQHNTGVKQDQVTGGCRVLTTSGWR